MSARALASSLAGRAARFRATGFLAAGRLRETSGLAFVAAAGRLARLVGFREVVFFLAVDFVLFAVRFRSPVARAAVFLRTVFDVLRAAGFRLEVLRAVVFFAVLEVFFREEEDFFAGLMGAAR